MTIPLRQSAPATAGSNGRAVATIQPLRSFERWHITRTAVSSNSTILAPTARVYRGAESPSALVEGTYAGRLDSSDTAIWLENGEALIVVWEGADVGSSCVVTIEGEVERAV
jgi:hypothetical protein